MHHAGANNGTCQPITVREERGVRLDFHLGHHRRSSLRRSGQQGLQPRWSRPAASFA